MVFQGAMSSFNPTITIEEHFRETIEAHGCELDDGMEHARELLSELYLEPERVLNSHAHELSGGMKQRALIALSLVLRPNVLVMDEPTAALDLLMQRSILSLLQDLKERYNLTVVFITHDLPLVAGLADRMGVMYAFNFVEIGSSNEILTNPKHPYTRALLNAVPNLQTPLDEMTTIEGASPDPVNVPEGCAYHPRCPLADEQCENVDPQLYDVDDDHTAACHYWEQSQNAIPLAIREESRDGYIQIEGQQSEDPVISLNDIEVYFESSTANIFDFFNTPDVVHAVDGVSLDLYENDVVALVGESGCGKTTLGKAAIGAQRPTDGDVIYRGQNVWNAMDWIGDVDITHEEIRRSLQIVHQDPGSSLNPNRTVQATLSAPLKRWRPDIDAQTRQVQILNMLEHVGMTPADDYGERYPHQLSGGEKQRVALVRAMLMNPDLILADEAVSALDVSLRVEMMDLMLELQDLFKTSYLFISHNLSNARYFAGQAGGRIGVMYLGEIVEIGPAEEIIHNPQHPYTKVLKWSTADLEGEDHTRGPPIRGIDIPDPINPPEGCRFHTRCPEARDVCTRETPTVDSDGSSGEHATACFRTAGENHEYWSSEPLAGTQNTGVERVANSEAGSSSETADGD
jgi:peptide/nickel transport system ATP-binding protein